MKALWITLAIIAGLILLITLLLLLGRAKIRIVSKKTVKVILLVLGIRFVLFSNEKKEAKKKNLSRCRHPDRVLRKELRKRRKAARAALKKKKKAGLKAQKKKARKAAQAATVPAPNLVENLEMVSALLKKLRDLTRGKISLRIRRLRVAIGSDDAAKTAILYGVTVQSAAYLLNWLDQNFAEIRSNPGETEIVPDYTSEHCRAEIDISCALYLSQLLGIAIRMLSTYRSARAFALKQAKLRTQQV